jgi:hypothetical protein
MDAINGFKNESSVNHDIGRVELSCSCLLFVVL